MRVAYPHFSISKLSEPVTFQTTPVDYALFAAQKGSQFVLTSLFVVWIACAFEIVAWKPIVPVQDQVDIV